jgi:hypothetical protein
MTYDIGRVGQVLIAEEATYGVTPSLLATMALRHLNIGFAYNPKNRVNSDEKKASPGRKQRFDRATTAGLNLKSAYLRPSGTIQTIPECHLLLKHGLGAVTIGTLTTTVASATSSTVFTVQAGQGANVAIGEFVSVRRAANANIPEVRKVVAKATDQLTVSPALGGTPAAADTVKAGITYTLATNISKSISAVHYLTDITRVVKGAVIDQLTLNFDRNNEVTLAVTGPGQTLGTPASSPGFTTVGAQNPPSGLLGGLLINGTAYKFLKAQLVLKNNLTLVNENYGTSQAEDFYRNGFRDISFTFDARVTDDVSVYTIAKNVTSFEFFMQTGQTEGNIVAVYAPNAEFSMAPDFNDDNGAMSYPFAGVMTESAAAGNDEISIGLC